MKPTLACFVALALAGCAPFNATNAPPPAADQQSISTDSELVTAYIDCVNGYAITRANYDVTAYELADAAIGACSNKLNDVRVRYAQRGTSDGGERAAAHLREEMRARVLTHIIEARNMHKPQRAPASTSGT
jgi:hypothetical protein